MNKFNKINQIEPTEEYLIVKTLTKEEKTKFEYLNCFVTDNIVKTLKIPAISVLRNKIAEGDYILIKNEALELKKQLMFADNDTRVYIIHNNDIIAKLN